MVTGDAFSITGIITLAVIVLAGPITFFVIAMRNKGEAPSETRRMSARSLPGVTDGREVIDDTSYLLSLLGFAIGIGNLWRFPFLVGRYGGGAFVLAYLVCLFFVSMPAFMIEMVMGQYTRQSTINCFKKILPGATGLGYAQLVMCGVILVYYNILLVYAIIYMVGSLYTPLPWTATAANPNATAADYFNGQVLNSLSDEEKLTAWTGALNPPLAYGLAFVWGFIFLALAFGKEVLAKITWVTVVGPVVMLAIILCRVVFLDGAWDGIQFYIFKFDSQFLYDPEVWAIACGQILFSLSPGMGTAITFSSFTTPKANVFRTCIQVAMANSLFSLTGGFAIFSIVGNITYRINEAAAMGDGMPTTVADQAGKGPGLTFITMADAMQFFGPLSNIISVLFFTTLFALGLDSSFALIETFVSTVEDLFYEKMGRKPNRIGLVFLTCAIFFVVGLLHATSRGLDLLDIFDHFVTSYFLLFGVAMEGLLFTFYFGYTRMTTHVKLTTHGNSGTPEGQDVTPSFLWKFAIGITMPLFSFVLFFQLFYKDIVENYGTSESQPEGFPQWMRTIGWLQLVTLMVITFGVGFVQGKAKPAGDLPPLQDDEGRLYTVQNVGSQVPLAGAGETELSNLPGAIS